MSIALYTLSTVSSAILTMPSVVTFLMLIVVLYIRNRRTVTMQKMVIGGSMNSTLELTISQIVLGILAGAAGSLILSYLGVVFNNEDTVAIVFALSIILMLLRSRFVCFSYSAGALAFISVIYQILKKHTNYDLSVYGFLNIDIEMLVLLVAVMHIVEGILVMVDGDRGAIPIFTKKDNRVIGGFALKRYWAVPIAVMFILSKSAVTGGGIDITTPSFWPIIKSSYLINPATAVIGMLPFFGMIGHSSITFTKTKRYKAVNSGLYILTYGVLLLLIAQLARFGLAMQLLAAIFMPVAHEVMLKAQIYLEINGKPKYENRDVGLVVLEVKPMSPAYEMGVKSGDVIVEINDEEIITEQDMINSLKSITNFIWLKVENSKGENVRLEYNKMNRGKALGIIFVPKNISKENIIRKYSKSKFKDVLEKVKEEKDDKDDKKDD